MKLKKILKYLIIAMIIILPTLFLESNAANWTVNYGGKTYNFSNPPGKDSIGSYYYLMNYAGMHGEDLDETYNSSRFWNYLTNNISSSTEISRGRVYLNGTTPYYDETIVKNKSEGGLEIPFRNVCIQHNNGGFTDASVRITRVLIVNPNLTNPYEVKYYKSKDGKLSTEQYTAIRYNNNPNIKKVERKTAKDGNYKEVVAFIMKDGNKVIIDNDAQHEQTAVENRYLSMAGFAYTMATQRRGIVYWYAANYKANLDGFMKVETQKKDGVFDGDGSGYGDEAKKYRTFVRNYMGFTGGINWSEQTDKITNAATNVSSEYDGSNTIVGPFILNFPDGGGYNTITAKVKKGTQTISAGNITIVDSDKRNTTISSGATFYIKINGNYINDNLSISFENSYTLYGAVICIVEGADGAAVQNRAVYRPFGKTFTNKLDITVRANPKNIKIIKQDLDSKANLNGAVFRIYLNNITSVKINDKIINVSNYTQDDNKWYTFGKRTVSVDDDKDWDSNNIKIHRPTVDNDRIYIKVRMQDVSNIELKDIRTNKTKIYITIRETTPPYMYKNINKSKEIYTVYEYAGTSWNLRYRNTSAGSDESTDNPQWLDSKYYAPKKVSANSTDTITNETITIYNEKINPDNITILKKDLYNGDDLKGAIFQLALNNLTSFKINGKSINVTGNTYPKDDKWYSWYNGTKTEVSENDNDWSKTNNLKIKKDLTDNNKIYVKIRMQNESKIELTDIRTNSSKMYITIAETTAPNMYERQTGKVYTVYEFTNGAWKLRYRNTSAGSDESTDNPQWLDSKYYAPKKASANSTDTISSRTITIYNEKIKPGDITILKKDLETENNLQGAIFDVYLNNIISVKVLGTTINLSDYTEFDQWYNTNKVKISGDNDDWSKATNNIKVKRVKETIGDITDTNRIHIKINMKNVNEIKLQEIKVDKSEKVFITIEELKAPQGYENKEGRVFLVDEFISGSWKLRYRNTNAATNNTDYLATGNWLNNKYYAPKKASANSTDIISSRAVTIYNPHKPITNLTLTKQDKLSSSSKIKDAIFQIYLNRVEEIQLPGSDKLVNVTELFKGKSTGNSDNYYEFNLTTGTIQGGAISKANIKNAVKENPNKIYITQHAGNGINNITIIGLKTNSSGQIVIPKIVATSSGVKNGVIVTILEVIPPNNYLTLNESIRHYGFNEQNDLYVLSVFDDTRKDWKLVERGTLPEGVTSNLNNYFWNIANNSVNITIYNDLRVILSGQVWLDGQKGEKNVTPPNGKKDDNKFLAGVTVKLYNADVNGNKTENAIRTTKTANDGKYEFKDIPQIQNGYKIEFEYDGINYQETKSLDTGGKDSKADEVNRNGFNDKFKTISKDAATSKDGKTVTKLQYSYSNNKSILQANIDGTNVATNKKDFAIQANTAVYKVTTSNIDCGLVKKEFDLAIGTDIESAELKINEKTKHYPYSEVAVGELNLNNKTSSQRPTYDLYLNYSDYNYRKADYKTETSGAIANKTNPNDLKKEEVDKDNNGIIDYDNLNELSVYVTYSVILQNESTYNAKVEEFVYYYDEVYEAPEIKESDIYTYEIDTGKRKITFTSKGNGLTVNSPNYRATINIKFKLRTDIAQKIEEAGVLEAKNIAEITKYSTEQGGLIDKDSAPDNGITNGKITQWEDDTDESPGLKVSIGKTRTITGTVFEDSDKDGSNKDEKLVNDVIVQLIEIKKINGAHYEYIWKETKSGEDGQYKFEDFIAGNYIIRFIYGDGTTVDKTYNGQDYQSTKDQKYKEEWYNAENYIAGYSVARDNEARRLEVMSYSTTIDKTKADVLNAKSAEMLENTWMCAETSKMKVEIDSTEYNNVNFGLAKRPETKLVLEKHITGLKITPSGTGVQPIVDAKLNIDEIMKDNSVSSSKATGIKNGLSIIESTRDERGFWKVETDIEELAQGATLEVEYTYVVKDDSEEAYLSKYLVNAYESYEKGEKLDNSYNTYKDLLNGKAKEVKSNTKGNTDKYDTYLGQFYYTGVKGNEDSAVLSRVDTIEDNLNNKLKFSEISDSDFKKINDAPENKGVYDTNAKRTEEAIQTILQNKTATKFLGGEDNASKIDTTKKVNLTTTLTASSKEISYPTYLEEIVQYSNAAGRRDMEATPGNLGYVHSEDNEMTLNSYVKKDEQENIIGKSTAPTAEYVKLNESDEFWGEKIIVSKPTGENKQAPIQIIVITISSIAVLGVGIILIKKYALKK